MLIMNLIFMRNQSDFSIYHWLNQWFMANCLDTHILWSDKWFLDIINKVTFNQQNV